MRLFKQPIVRGKLPNFYRKIYNIRSLFDEWAKLWKGDIPRLKVKNKHFNEIF